MRAFIEVFIWCATDRQQKPAPGGMQECLLPGVRCRILQQTRGLIDLYNLTNFCPRRYKRQR